MTSHLINNCKDRKKKKFNPGDFFEQLKILYQNLTKGLQGLPLNNLDTYYKRRT